MDLNTIRASYINFFVNKANHKEIPAAPLVPPDDPTTLFTSSGMQQLVPYLKGETHPMGKRLVNSQPCFRAEDIDEVGDNRHTTFFEMLGNWSLGDYFKHEQLSWFWEFLTQEIKLPSDRLFITIFDGDNNNHLPRDEEAYKIWESLGVKPDHIHYYDATKNWWSRAGTPDNMPAGEIGGPDSEVFYDFDPDQKLDIHNQSKFKNEKCHINCECGRYLEIGNSVFMQYIKQEDGSFTPLPKQNVDFGGGLIRLAAASQNQIDIFETDAFQPIVSSIEKLSGKTFENNSKESIRIIADHMRAAVVMIATGVEPSNKMQGYIVRRLIRRSALKLYQLKSDSSSNLALVDVAEEILNFYHGYLFDKQAVKDHVNQVVSKEIEKFTKSLSIGLKEFEKANVKQLNPLFAFKLKQTYGFPPEITQELFKQKNINFNWEEYKNIEASHKDLSRTTAAKMFKGGLADSSADVTKLHTTTHLLHQALRQVLGDHVQQEGSNITAERLRFDYQHPDKPTPAQLQEIENIINQAISKNLPVTKTIEDKTEALKSGAMAFFKETYPEKVSVYTIGSDPKNNWFSKEFCGGPHVNSTGEIGTVTIKKDKSIGAGMRRIYVVLTSQNGNKKHSFKNQSNT
jgi:alanyl-tRNA synthetase